MKTLLVLAVVLAAACVDDEVSTLDDAVRPALIAAELGSGGVVYQCTVTAHCGATAEVVSEPMCLDPFNAAAIGTMSVAVGGECLAYAESTCDGAVGCTTNCVKTAVDC